MNHCYLNFAGNTSGGSGCSDYQGPISITQGTVLATINQTMPGKATCGGSYTYRALFPAPNGVTYATIFTTQFDIEFTQPGAGWCGDDIPVTIPVQSITINGDFSNTQQPPATTAMIQGSGRITTLNGDWNYPSVILDQVTVTENGVPCTTWKFAVFKI